MVYRLPLSPNEGATATNDPRSQIASNFPPTSFSVTAKRSQEKIVILFSLHLYTSTGSLTADISIISTVKVRLFSAKKHSFACLASSTPTTVCPLSASHNISADFPLRGTKKRRFDRPPVSSSKYLIRNAFTSLRCQPVLPSFQSPFQKSEVVVFGSSDIVVGDLNLTSVLETKAWTF